MDEGEIYVKTPKGVAEVAVRSATLSMAARRVLIMMDGKRPMHELAVLVRPGEIEAIVTQLESAGLAEKAGLGASTLAPLTIGANPRAEPPVPLTAPATDERELAPMTLEEAKRRAVRELNERLGPEADLIAIRIENCRSVEEFRERVRDAERFVTSALGTAAAQDYLRALRRRP
jgi:hypothetical protein